jgi:hypothetical protein
MNSLPDSWTRRGVSEARMNYTRPEAAYLERIRTRLAELREYLGGVSLSEESHISEWFSALAKIKAIQGNINNDLSFLACLLAKRYLEKHFGLNDFDAAAKPQGAAGLDINVTVPSGKRLIAEIKTTVPYLNRINDLGAKQKESFRNDFAKLNNTAADYKFFFVTDKATFDVVKRKYSSEIPGVEIILLDLEARSNR